MFVNASKIKINQLAAHNENLLLCFITLMRNIKDVTLSKYAITVFKHSSALSLRPHSSQYIFCKTK